MSESNRTQLYYVPESTWGVTPASALTALRFTGESLSYGITTKTSDEIRSDRMVSDLILTGASAGGGVNWELSYGTYDDFFKAALMASAWSTAVNVSAATDIAAVQSGNKYTGTTTNFTTKNISVGQWIKVSGFTNSANNGFKLVTSVAAGELAVSATASTALVNESATPAITMTGTMIRNGTTETSFTLERLHEDITQYFAYTGMVPNQMKMSISAGNIITGNFDFKGKSETLSGSTVGTGTANAATTTEAINAVSNVASIIEGSTLAAMSGVYVQALDFTLANNARDLTAIGSLGAVDMGYGRCDITGTLKAYFINNTLYDKYITNTRSGLSFRMADNAGNAYIVTFPAIEFSSAKVNAGGANQDITVDIGWTAIRHATNNCMIQIDKFAAA